MRKRDIKIYPREVLRTGDSANVVRWYAMRIAAARSIKRVLEGLKAVEVEYFSPIDTIYKKEQKRVVGVETPLIGSLVFCRATEAQLVDIVNVPGFPLIFYYPRIKSKDSSKWRVVISDSEMDRFIKFATTDYLNPKLLTIEEAKTEMHNGKTIHFTQGIFAGHTAVVSTKRHHRRRIVVTLENYMALTIEMPKDC